MLLVIRVSHRGETDRWDEFRRQDFKGARQIIICGDENLETAYELNDDVLLLRCRDLWEDLPEKMIAAYSILSEIKEFSQYTAFLKIDADIVPKDNFNPDQIVDLLKKHHYIGANLRTPPASNHGIYHLKKGLTERSPWRNKKYSNREFLSCTFALGGFGYGLSRRALKIICNRHNFKNLADIKNEFIYEDAMVAIILKRNGIKPYRFRIPLTDTQQSRKSSRRRRLRANRSMSLVRAKGAERVRRYRKRNM